MHVWAAWRGDWSTRAGRVTRSLGVQGAVPAGVLSNGRPEDELETPWQQAVDGQSRAGGAAPGRACQAGEQNVQWL